MFLDNKYTKAYYNIVNDAKTNPRTGYVERHHIIPKCMGGSEVVALTAREHFICHLLLTKMTEGNARNKMLSAVFYLTGRGKAKRNNVLKSSRLYENLKKQHAKVVSKQKKGCKQPPRTKLTRQRLSVSKTGTNNPRFKHHYVTPWGTFESSRLASAKSNMSDVGILNFCTKKNEDPISNLSIARSRGSIPSNWAGKTPKQLGFGITNG